MNKSAIDFFSRGLTDKKTRLSIKVFGLDSKCQIKQSPLKRKISFSHLNFNKFDRKLQEHNKQQKQKHKQKQGSAPSNSIKNKKMLSATQTNFVQSQSLTPVRKKAIKFSNKHIYDTIVSLSNIVDETQNRKSNLFPKYESMPSHLNVSQTQRVQKSIARITQQCQLHQESYNTEVSAQKMQVLISNMKNEDEINEQKDQYNEHKKIFKKKQSNKQQQPKRNFYFIRNLVLQNNPCPNQNLNYSPNQNIQRCYSQQKYIIRRLPAVSFAASNIYRNSQHINPLPLQQPIIKQYTGNKYNAKNKGQFQLQNVNTLNQAKTCINIRRRQKIKQIILPSSLITNRIGYNAQAVKPAKKKLPRNFLVTHSKMKKMRQVNEYGIIDRWEYAKEDHNCWELQKIS